MKIALAQVNPTVGDLLGNAHKIIQYIERAKEADAKLVVFPELVLLGYPPKDLLLKPSLIKESEQLLTEIAKACEGLTAIVGYAGVNVHSTGRPLVNAAAILKDGKIVGKHIKSLLPTYDVFDESRYFEPGPDVDVTVIEGVPMGISICEDLWNDPDMMDRRLYHDNPISDLADAGACLFINCSASPFQMGKHAFRQKLFENATRRHALPLLYVNQVGGNDELVFDGNSCAYDEDGNIIAHAKDFEEDMIVVDIDLPHESVPSMSEKHIPPVIHAPRNGMAAVNEALTLGLRDYLRKCGFSKVILGLSGGIDSAVACVIAVQAVGAENVTGVAMPSRFSSDGSRSDARLLAESLGVNFHEIAITPAHEAMEQMVEPYFKGTEFGIAEENIQARLRGVLLMSFSNKFNAMVVTTGNKTELAVGYCTLYGDMCGGLAVIADLPKMMVYELAQWMNTEACASYDQEKKQGPIPIDTITKPPSAELRAGQLDEDSLPPYEILDQIVDRYVEREQSVAEIVEKTGFEQAMVERFTRLIDRNEYKRKQAAPGLKVTGRAFGSGRRAPIAQRYQSNPNIAADLHHRITDDV